MLRNAKFLPLLSILLAALGVAMLSRVVAQQTSTLDVSGSRPLMKAIDAIETKLRVSINYEDPQYQHPDDVQDVTDEVQSPRQRAANPNVRIIVPKPGQLSLYSPILSQRQAASSDVLSLLTQLRAAHEAKNLPGRFVIVQRESVWTVEPSGIRSRAGGLIPAASVLNAHLTFPFQQRNAAECLMLFVKQASQASGAKIGLGAYPIVGFVNVNVACGATDEPANIFLPKLLAEVSARQSLRIPVTPLQSYRLLYDPGIRYYLLSINSAAVNVYNMELPPPGTTNQSPQILGPGFLRGNSKK